MKNDYKSDPKFLELSTTYASLAKNTLTISQELKKMDEDLSTNLDVKIAKLQEFAESFIKFDEVLKEMMIKFPDYYLETKSFCDKLMTENMFFHATTIKEIEMLRNPSSINDMINEIFPNNLSQEQSVQSVGGSNQTNKPQHNQNSPEYKINVPAVKNFNLN